MIRKSDRWVTPGVIIAALITSGLVLAAIVAAVAYLAARGVNPDPMIRLVSEVATATSALGALILQLVGRITVTKVERNTGALYGAVTDVLQQSAQPAPGNYVADVADVEPATTETFRPPVPSRHRH